ncbi:hypothetical protein TMatcc_005979 [Talaromyces marneffei ATCC 18224]|uniref:Myb-like domain-containing protein n=2 Tax=Talaromyces marneffei TaxID=37727 RepID=B6Q8I3_TALMQ|nr:uncharacterized protein EYB26_005527 [Talaromyces marneffei]EEA25787.1 conserved hypothetical protein [Talaromyces marneffei ATCC 18224]KAE8554484.1 hypothetical protein EYB25_003023 [Talaromyces marneffei]QGA17851.1 hypothetical protein EYB26_005527 [Talaromyces marneffei]
MVNWTPELVSKFLITTLQQVSPQISRDAWKTVADAMGSDISAEACRQKYAKLLGAQGIELGAATPSAATPGPATPKSGRKRKATAGTEATPSKSASAKKAKKAQPAVALKTKEYEDQETELIISPIPSFKTLAPADDSD